MYAIPFLLALATLVALVYLPKIRRPALWLSTILIGLAILVAGGVWAYTSYQDSKQRQNHERELSYEVDHAIGKPPHCKSKPFTNKYAAFMARADAALAEPAENKFRRGGEYVPTGKARAKAPAREIEELLARGQRPSQAPSAPFDPDAYLCQSETDELAKFIKENTQGHSERFERARYNVRENLPRPYQRKQRRLRTTPARLQIEARLQGTSISGRGAPR